MASTICTPISGRLCLVASALFLSVFGRPVAGSFGSLSQIRAPHSAPPQLVMRTWLSLSAVYQVPSGSAARAGPLVAIVAATSVASPSADADERTVVMAGFMAGFTANFMASLHCRPRGRDHSRGGGDCLVPRRFRWAEAKRYDVT